MLQNYMTKACINTSLEKYLFRPIFRSGKSCKLLDKDKKVNLHVDKGSNPSKIEISCTRLKPGSPFFEGRGVTTAANVPEYFGRKGFISGFRDRLCIFIWDTSFCHIMLIYYKSKLAYTMFQKLLLSIYYIQLNCFQH